MDTNDKDDLLSIAPQVRRDFDGNVIRSRSVLVVDVIPDGKSYRLSVSAEDITDPERLKPVASLT